MKISELVKKLLEDQKEHGDLECFDENDCVVIDTTFYPEDSEEAAFLVIEVE
jgi:hypothetical protein